jgi:cold shock CspA family protein
VVDWSEFNAYGFIARDSDRRGRHLFLHLSQTGRRLKPGTRISFALEHNKRGLRATDVMIERGWKQIIIECIRPDAISSTGVTKYTVRLPLLGNPYRSLARWQVNIPLFLELPAARALALTRVMASVGNAKL